MYQIKALNTRLIEAYKRCYGFGDFYAKLLVAKGFGGEEVLNLKKPTRAILDPRLLVNGEKACEQIKTFLKQHKKSVIWIYADYDCDGMTSAYIMHYALTHYIGLIKADCDVEVYLPERSEGYGIHATWANKLSTALPTLVITVDNGTNAVEAIRTLNKRNIPVIVTDHHMPEEKVADCLIVNPNYHAKDPHKHLAGCGVAYKLGMLLVGAEVMTNVIDVLCIGTIGDMMAMTSENIAFCQLGLKKINSGDCHKGIIFFKEDDSISYKDIAFNIVPKLNCCGRMGNMALGKTFMFAPDYETYHLITALNEDRKALTKKYVELSKKQQSNVVILETCGAGIAGIIAGQLTTIYHSNTIVLVGESDKLVGSARAFSGNVLEQINSLTHKYPSLFASGHDEACGISINKSEAEAFAKDFNALQHKQGKAEQTDFVHQVDFELELDNVNTKILSIIRSLPYDKAHLTEPIFAISANLDKKERTKSNPDNVWLYLSASNSSKKLKVWAQDMSNKAFNLKSKKNLKFIASIEKDFMNPAYATLKIIDIIE